MDDKSVADIFNGVGAASDLFDTFSHYNVEHFLSGLGLCVHADYRGRGIATEMIKARTPFLKALGLQVTSTAFTAIGSQLAAKNAGYDEVFSIAYDDLQKTIPYFDFSRSKVKCFKMLATKI